jgi:sn-glycerol 3-phosphate transport system substrate-binding protein
MLHCWIVQPYPDGGGDSMKIRAMTTKCFCLLLLAGFFLLPPGAVAKTRVVFWHAMGGFLGEKVTEIVTKFNASQSEFEVEAVNKGSYPEALTAGIAAYRAKTHPQILQVFEVGTQTMLSSGAVYPVFQLMKDQGVNVNWADFLSVVKSYYSYKNNLYSMPFNSSTAILYYNKSIFKKAGLNPQKAPATFDEIEKAAKAVVLSGATKIGFTVSWPSWILLENMHAWHDQPFADKDNGFEGMATELKFNGRLGGQLLDLISRWRDEGVFTYSGRGSKGDQPIINGEAAIGIASTALVGTLTKTAKFEWGTGPLPRISGYPIGNSIIGGASLWVMKGHKTEEYKGVAKFLEFVGRPDQQAWWHAETGYLPVSNSALKALQATDHFKKNPNLWTAFAQITMGKTTKNSQGMRLGNFSAIRDIIEGEMENILANKKTSQQGLGDAVKKGNEMLKEFASMYK